MRELVGEFESERERLERILRESPGLHLRELQRRTEFGWGKLTHHIDVLARQGKVLLVRRARFVHAFPAEAVDEPPRPAGTAAVVLDAIPERRRVTQGELHARLGLSPQLLSYHLRALVEARLVEVEPTRPRGYSRRVSQHGTSYTLGGE